MGNEVRAAAWVPAIEAKTCQPGCNRMCAAYQRELRLFGCGGPDGPNQRNPSSALPAVPSIPDQQFALLVPGFLTRPDPQPRFRVCFSGQGHCYWLGRLNLTRRQAGAGHCLQDRFVTEQGFDTLFPSSHCPNERPIKVAANVPAKVASKVVAERSV